MKITPVLLCLLMLLVFVSGCSDSEMQDKVNADLGAALKAAVIGQNVKADYWCDQAIAVDPQALSTYISTSQSDDDNPPPTIEDVFVAVGDDSDLRLYMQRAVQRFPSAWQPLQALVQADVSLGDINAQHADAAKLAALLERKMVTPGQTHDETLMLMLAQAYCDAGNLTQGAADYQNVIRTFPKDSEPYNGLAYAWAVANSKPNLPQALAYAQKALSIAQTATPSLTDQGQVDLNIAEVQDTLGWVQYRLGDDQNAAANLEAVISLEPRLAESHYHLGMVYLALKQPDAARVELEHAVQIEPGLAEAQTALAALPKPAPSEDTVTTESLATL